MAKLVKIQRFITVETTVDFDSYRQIGHKNDSGELIPEHQMTEDEIREYETITETDELIQRLYDAEWDQAHRINFATNVMFEDWFKD